MTCKRSWSTLVLVVGAVAFASDGWAEDQGARQILQRAIQTVGGERTLARLKLPMMWMERGTFYGTGQELSYVAQYAAKWPLWYRQEVENAFTITVSGKKAWVSNADGTQELTGSDLQERMKQTRVAWAERLFPLTDKAYKLHSIDGIQVGGRATVGIRTSHPDGRDIKFYFDEQTYLISKIETMVISPLDGASPDPVLSEAYYSDHKSFGGVKMPSKLKLYYDKQLIVEGETIDYKIAATLDPKHFEEP